MNKILLLLFACFLFGGQVNASENSWKYENKIIWDGQEITDPNARVSFAVMIYPSKQTASPDLEDLEFKLNGTYDRTLGYQRLSFENNGAFWQIPHMTAIIFTAKRSDLEKVQILYGEIATSFIGDPINFVPKDYEFFGNWFVAKTDKRLTEPIVLINNLVYDWLGQNIPSASVKSIHSPGNINPHMSLNTTVPRASQARIKAAVAKSLKDYRLLLNTIVITAMKP